MEGCLARFEPSPCAGDKDFGLGLLRDEPYSRQWHPDLDRSSMRGLLKTKEGLWAKKRWRNLLPFVCLPEKPSETSKVAD